MFSEGHNNGIVEGIYRIAMPNVVYLVYTFDDTIIMCMKTVLCIKSGFILVNQNFVRTLIN